MSVGVAGETLMNLIFCSPSKSLCVQLEVKGNVGQKLLAKQRVFLF